MNENNNIKNIKEILEIVENKPIHIVVILLIFILPSTINKWIILFPQSWKSYVVIIFLFLWLLLIYFLWREIKAWRRKTRLVNYLERHGPHRSYHHLTTEWDAKDDYSKKIIKKLIDKFPNELHDVPMGKYGPGVGINSKTKIKND